MLLISNNPKIIEELATSRALEVLPIQGKHGEVLLVVRDKIHLGHKLLSHPLSGSVKPNQTPYKSVLISKKKGQLDLDGLAIIEQALETYKKFGVQGKNWYDDMKESDFDQKIKSDFAEIDYSLIKSAIDNIKV